MPVLRNPELGQPTHALSYAEQELLYKYWDTFAPWHSLYALPGAVPNPSLAMFAICSCCHECLVCICVVPLREECTFWKFYSCLFALDFGCTRRLYIVYTVYVAYIRLSRTVIVWVLPRYTTMCVLPHFIAVITTPTITPLLPHRRFAPTTPYLLSCSCLAFQSPLECCWSRYLPKLIVYVYFLYSAPAHGQPVSESQSRCGAQAPLLPCFLFVHGVLRGEDHLNLIHSVVGPKIDVAFITS